jgi:Isocitrate/isopropylmalate dehydrogenase
MDEDGDTDTFCILAVPPLLCEPIFVFAFNIGCQMVHKPSNFDVLVMPNLYGDILR